MKKFPPTRIFAAFALVFCSFAMLFIFESHKKQGAAEPVYSPNEAGAPQMAVSLAARSESQNRGYTVKAHEGTVCVFSYDGALVLKTLINVSKLRQNDVNSLKVGIFAPDMTKVWQLLEDFGS